MSATHNRQPPKQTGRDPLVALRDLYLSRFNKAMPPPGGQAQMWLEVVKEFLTTQAWDLIPYMIIEQEERVVSMGLATEYLAELVRLADFSPQMEEADKAVLLLTVGPEIRRKALATVLFGAIHEQREW